MKKTLYTLILLTLLLAGCNNDRTEIKIKLSDSNYLHQKYPGWFEVNMGPENKTMPENERQEFKAEIEEAKEDAIKVLAKRIESAADPVSGISGKLNKVKITTLQLPEADTWTFTINRKEPENISALLEKRIECGFWETYMITEIWDRLARINSLIKEGIDAGEINIQPDTTELGRENPLFRFLIPMINGEGSIVDGCEMGNSRISDTSTVNMLLSLPQVRAQLPNDLKPVWTLKPRSGTEDYYSLIALKIPVDGSPLLTDKNMVEASVDSKRYPPAVNISLDTEGAMIMSRITADNLNRNIAMTVDNAVYFYPRVLTEIKEGKISVSADFTGEEARELAILLGSGTMPPLGVKVIDVKE